METVKKSSAPLFIVAIIMVAMIITSIFYLYGISNTNDSLMHFSFASSIYDSVSHGEIFPSGEPNINRSYGGYGLRFYPSFTHYFLAAAYFLTNDWQTAGFLFFWFWMSLSGIGLYFLAREWLDEIYAFIGAILFIFEPYHNVQIHSTYATGEFVAGCLLTFCFLFLTRLIKHGKTIDVIGLAIFYGFLIVTHIPITLIGSICLGIYGLTYLFFSGGWKDRVIKLFIGLAGGVLASSFYLYRLFSELSWIAYSDSKYLSQGGFDFRYFFIDLRGYFFPGDLVLYNFLILLIPPTILILLKGERELKKAVCPIISVTFFSLFMATSYSQPVWETFKIIHNVQFPWRWLVVASIGYGIIIALSIPVLLQLLKGKKLVTTIWSVFFVIASSYFTYSFIIGANLLDADFFLLKNGELNNVVLFKSNAPYPVFLQTVWANPSAFDIQEKVLANDRKFELLSWERYRKSIRISAGEPTAARISISYYPHWKAKVNGVAVEVSKTDDGAILIPVSNAESVIELEFVEPFLIKFFFGFSGFIWLTLLTLLLLNLSGRFKSKTNQN